MKEWILQRFSTSRRRQFYRNEFLRELDERIAKLNARPLETRNHYVASNGTKVYVTPKAVRHN
jgi:hypothetical protein